MAIPNNTPLTVPASAEKEFPHLWIQSIKVAAPNHERGGLEIKTVPYNADTGEIADANPTRIRSTNLWSLLNECPQVAEAMEGIFAALPALNEYLTNED